VRSTAALLALLLSLLAVLASSPSIGFAQPAIPSGPIRVVSHGSSIKFGEAVDVTLRVESEAGEITAIKAFYRPQGTRTITTYGYAGFTRGRSVNARVTIPTASPMYYPPGVVFEVTYEIEDAAGNRLETDPVTVEYLDPAFAWKRRTRDALTVIYHDRPESTVDGLLEQVAGRILRIVSTVGGDPAGGNYRAILFNSNSEARKAFPFISQAASDGHVFAGFAYEQYGLFVLDHAGVQGVTHELTHLLFGRATNAPTAKRPAWLNEGLAVYFETGSRASSGSRLRGFVRDGRLLSLRSMNSIPGRPEQIDVFYPQAGNFVGYLIERHGEERMRRLVAAFRGGALPLIAVQTAYGVSLDELEAQWRRDVGAAPLPTVPAGVPAGTPEGSPSGSPAGEGAAQRTPVTTPGAAVDPTAVAPTPPAAVPGGQPTATPVPVEDATELPPSFTIWWFVAGLAVAAAVFAAIYFVRRTRREGP
jgi:hypothetical protein